MAIKVYTARDEALMVFHRLADAWAHRHGRRWCGAATISVEYPKTRGCDSEGGIWIPVKMWVEVKRGYAAAW